MVMGLFSTDLLSIAGLEISTGSQAEASDFSVDQVNIQMYKSCVFNNNSIFNLKTDTKCLLLSSIEVLHQLYITNKKNDIA